MRRSFFSAALVMALLAIGCTAGTTPDYDTRVATERDFLDCQNQSYVSTGTMTDPGGASERQQQIIDECMRHKGYSIND